MRIGLLLVVTALTLALAVWYLRADSAPAPLTSAPARTVVPATAKLEAARASASPSRPPRPIADAPPAKKSADDAAQFRNAGDLLSFLERLAPAAAEGDVDALYYLGACQQALHA